MIKLSIDLGSSTTKIYRADTNSGIQLSEPSCVAVVTKGEEEKIRAIGKEAKHLLGKTAELTKIIYPVYEGKIFNMRYAVAMLKEFLARIKLTKVALRRAQALFSVPCGISDEELSDYVALARACGLKKAWFVEQPFLGALGSGAALTESEPVFCMDIGGGVSNIAVLSADGIITGLSMNVGGNNMDANIISKIAKTKGLLVGALTAEKIKNEIGSLSTAALGTMVAQGSSTQNYQPFSAEVRANELTDCIQVYVDKVVEYAEIALRNLAAEVSATVNRGGVYLSGGVMKTQRLPQYLSSKLGASFRMGDDPQFATVLGGGVLLKDKRLLNRFARSYEK